MTKDIAVGISENQKWQTITSIHMLFFSFTHFFLEPPSHLPPSLAHLFASPRLSRQSNNLYLEATGPRQAAEGEPKELAIAAN